MTALRTRITGTLVAVGALLALFTLWGVGDSLEEQHDKTVTLAWRTDTARISYITWAVNARANSDQTGQKQWGRVINGHAGDHIVMIVETNIVAEGSCSIWVNGVRKAAVEERSHDCRVSYTVQPTD